MQARHLQLNECMALFYVSNRDFSFGARPSWVYPYCAMTANTVRPTHGAAIVEAVRNESGTSPIVASGPLLMQWQPNKQRKLVLTPLHHFISWF